MFIIIAGRSDEEEKFQIKTFTDKGETVDIHEGNIDQVISGLAVSLKSRLEQEERMRRMTESSIR